jgi:hypothetical protein
MLATLVGGVFMFLLGWLVFGILLMDYYAANTIHYEGLMKPMPNLVLIFVSNLSFSFLLAFIFERWAKVANFKDGLMAGLAIGLPLMISFDLWFVAGMNLFSNTSIVVDIIVNTICFGLLGGVIGWVLGFKKATA